jgi:hypothetical protein
VQLYLCDESGDPGTSVSAGASPLFVICMIGYPDGIAAQEFQKTDAELRQRLGWRGEFRWSKLSQRSRDTYFASLSAVMPVHHAVIWDKLASNEVQSPKLPPEIGMIRQAMANLGGPAPSSRLIIDGVRHRDRAGEIRRALGVAEVRFEHSHANPHLQLADMPAGFHAWDQVRRIKEVTPQLRSLRRFRSLWR